MSCFNLCVPLTILSSLICHFSCIASINLFRIIIYLNDFSGLFMFCLVIYTNFICHVLTRVPSHHIISFDISFFFHYYINNFVRHHRIFECFSGLFMFPLHQFNRHPFGLFMFHLKLTKYGLGKNHCTKSI